MVNEKRKAWALEKDGIRQTHARANVLAFVAEHGGRYTGSVRALAAQAKAACGRNATERAVRALIADGVLLVVHDECNRKTLVRNTCATATPVSRS